MRLLWYHNHYYDESNPIIKILLKKIFYENNTLNTLRESTA